LQIVAQAPVIADLLSAAIAAGASVPDALDAVITAIEEPARGRLESVRASMQLGAPATIAWADLLDDDALAPIAGAVIRSSRTGASISAVLDAAAVDMRQAHRAQVEVAARSAGVRAVAPLALCFLPAYLLVGVVPVVAGFAQALFA
jgi:Flp pilus assembly protein TadB